MAQELGFAYEYSRLLTAALERGDRKRAMHYNDRVRQLLEREEEPQELILNLESEMRLPASRSEQRSRHILSPSRPRLNPNGPPPRGRQSLKV